MKRGSEIRSHYPWRILLPMRKIFLGHYSSQFFLVGQMLSIISSAPGALGPCRLSRACVQGGGGRASPFISEAPKAPLPRAAGSRLRDVDVSTSQVKPLEILVSLARLWLERCKDKTGDEVWFCPLI